MLFFLLNLLELKSQNLDPSVAIIRDTLPFQYDTTVLKNITDLSSDDRNTSIATNFSSSINELVVMPSPNAMNNMVQSDADLYTGRVSSSVPLYNFKSREIEVPISVSYSSSGIKVNDNRQLDWFRLESQLWWTNHKNNEKFT